MLLDRALQTKSRDLLNNYGDVLAYAQKEILEELEKERITGDTSFEVAKKVLRKEGIKEGMILLQQRINKYGT